MRNVMGSVMLGDMTVPPKMKIRNTVIPLMIITSLSSLV